MLIIFKELTKQFEQSLLDSLEKNDKKGEFDNLRKNLVTQSSKEEFGDYQCNVCLSLSKIYKKNPKRLLKRLWQTLIPIFTYLFSVGWDKLTGRLKNKENARFRAKELTNLLVELGPAFVKAGQALSTRPDIIPGILLEELSELQDQLPGFDGDKAMELIEEDLGSKIDEIFLEIGSLSISKNISSILEPKSSSINSIAFSPSKPGS